MCDTQLSIYLYSVRLESVHEQVVMWSLGFSVVGVFKRVFGMGSFSRRVTSAVSFCFSIRVPLFFFISVLGIWSFNS